MDRFDLTETAAVEYRSFDPGDPGAWTLVVAGDPVAKNTAIRSTDRDAARTWGWEALEDARATLLPTPAEMIQHANDALSEAYRALGDAADWLRSDWPAGCELTGEQAEQVARMREGIAAAKTAINRARP